MNTCILLEYTAKSELQWNTVYFTPSCLVINLLTHSMYLRSGTLTLTRSTDE